MQTHLYICAKKEKFIFEIKAFEFYFYRLIYVCKLNGFELWEERDGRFSLSYKRAYFQINTTKKRAFSPLKQKTHTLLNSLLTASLSPVAHKQMQVIQQITFLHPSPSPFQSFLSLRLRSKHRPTFCLRLTYARPMHPQSDIPINAREKERRRNFGGIIIAIFVFIAIEINRCGDGQEFL